MIEEDLGLGRVTFDLGRTDAFARFKRADIVPAHLPRLKQLLKKSGFEFNGINAWLGSAWGLSTAVRKLREAGFTPVLGPSVANEMGRLAQMSADPGSAARADARMDAMEAATGMKFRDYQREDVRWMERVGSCINANEMRVGKAQPLSEPVLTPLGWSTMGDLKVGDMVIGYDGRPKAVTAIYPQGVLPVYRISCQDGRWTRACGEHLWEVTNTNRRYRKQPPLVVSTLDLKTGTTGYGKSIHIKDKNGNNGAYLPLVAPVNYPESVLPIPPYVLGVLLGDGTLGCVGRGVSFCKKDTQLAELVLPELESIGYTLNRTSEPILPTWNIVRMPHNPLGFRHLLKHLNLEVNSLNKYIPAIYLTASVDQRLALLQGLLDTDSYVSGSNVEYCTSSEKLKDGVMELVKSLGGVCYTSSRLTASGNTGWRISIHLDGEQLYRRTQKLAQHKPRGKYKPVLAITDIQPDGEEACVCITVDCPRHLYVTRNYILTHNTVEALAMIGYAGAIVVCPLGVRSTWANHAKKWLPWCKVYMDYTAYETEPNQIIVVNYEYLPKLDLEVNLNGVLLIFDEGHMLKNEKAIRTQHARKLAEEIRNKDGRVLVTTGTPSKNGLCSELWSMLELIDKSEKLFRSREAFNKMFKHHFDMDIPIVGPLSQAMTRRTFASVVANLPPFTWEDIDVYWDTPGCDASVRRSLDVLWEKYQHEKDPLAAMRKTPRDIGEFSRLCTKLADYKTGTAMEWAERMTEANTPALVTSAHRDPVIKVGSLPGWTYIVGSMPEKERTERLNAFNRGDVIGMALTIGVGSMGLEMSRADNILSIDRSWVPGDNDQVYARVLSVDHPRPKFGFRLMIDHPIEHRIEQVLSEKKTNISGTVGKVQATTTNTVFNEFVDTTKSPDYVNVDEIMRLMGG